MRPTLWFCVPACGRVELARICLGQLRRTCDALNGYGISASAVVVADDENLVTARGLGFGTVRRDNRFLGSRFNDALQLATDPDYNPRPADYVVPLGSDDWVDHRLFTELELPDERTIVGFQWISFVREDGGQIASTFLNYRGGSGIRIIPRQLVEPLGYRPCDADRKRACDTSILVNLSRHWGDQLRIEHWHRHDRQIVDWKTPGEQINSYENVVAIHGSRFSDEPFTELAEFYPAEALEEMRAHYQTIGA